MSPNRFETREKLEKKKVCGSHFIYPKKNITHILLTGEPDCIIETKLMNIIFVRMFWNMEEKKFLDFFGKNFHLKTASLL